MLLLSSTRNTGVLHTEERVRYTSIYLGYIISFYMYLVVCSFLLSYMSVSRSLPNSNIGPASSTQIGFTCRPSTVKVDAPIRTTRNCGRKSTTYCRAADHGGNYRRMEELGVAYPVTVNNRRHNMPGRVELLPDGQHTVQPKEECSWMFEPGLQR